MNPSHYAVNILVTVDSNYVPCLNVMLFSMLRSNTDCDFQVYLLHSSLTEEDVQTTRMILDGAGALHLIQINDTMLKNAPTSSRYPKEIYYRIFAAQYLPNTLDKILYLDPDMIIRGDIRPLYETSLGDNYFAAASHLGKLFRTFNAIRLRMNKKEPYINSGVMLMNLSLLRQEQNPQEVFDFIRKHTHSLMLPDQDIISALYGSRILELDTFRYNMTERLYTRYCVVEKKFDFGWIRNNSAIIHYCGRNKPWKPNYHGELDVFYLETIARMKQMDDKENVQ